jgi:hypothetical protein
MMSAAEEVLGRDRAEEIADQTLKRWLVKVFDLKTWPAHATADEWKRIAREHYGAFLALIEERFLGIRK